MMINHLRELRGFAEPDGKYLMVYMGSGISPHRKGVSSVKPEGLWVARAGEAAATAGHRHQSNNLQDRTPMGKSLPHPRDPGEAGVRRSFSNTSDHSPLPTQ